MIENRIYTEPYGIFLGDSEAFASPPIQGIANTIRANRTGAGVIIPMEDKNQNKYRFYEQAQSVLKDYECSVGDTIDAFNKSVNKSGESPTVTTRPEGFKTAILVVDEQNGKVKDDKTIGCLTTDGSSPKHNNRVVYDYRIRKLTERECFRLMGVRDKDFDKIKVNQSKSSLYHLAGDSIVTTCLMAIFGTLIGVDYQSKIKDLERDLDQLR